jgi:hypothetical protein
MEDMKPMAYSNGIRLDLECYEIYGRGPVATSVWARWRGSTFEGGYTTSKGKDEKVMHAEVGELGETAARAVAMTFCNALAQAMAYRLMKVME